MKRVSTLGLILCLGIAGCSKPAAPAADNAAAANTAAADNVVVPETDSANGADTADAGADAIVGKWVDDENDSYSFAGDGTISSEGQVHMVGKWNADGEARYDIDLGSPAGPAKGLACVSGDTMAMLIGDGTTTYLGRVGDDGEPAKPDTSVKCA